MSDTRKPESPHDWMGEVLTEGIHAKIVMPNGRVFGSAFFEDSIDELALSDGFRLVTAAGEEVTIPGTPENGRGGEMPTHDQLIDARLAGIEKDLDNRMASMQRFQEQAEQRFQRTTERHETDVALTRQQIHQEFKDARREMASESQANRKHSTQVAIGTIAGVLAAFALVVAVGVGWITEQGGYSDMQLDQQQATQERAEFREAVQSIQQTQQSILERLPAQPQEPPTP